MLTFKPNLQPVRTHKICHCIGVLALGTKSFIQIQSKSVRIFFHIILYEITDCLKLHTFTSCKSNLKPQPQKNKISHTFFTAKTV